MASNEGRIRRLCSDLLAKRSDEDFEPLIVELRDALHQHIEDLRESLGSYPLHVEGRAGNEIRPHNRGDEAAAAGESRRQARVLKRRIA
jgi:hypothetical protein